MAVSVVPLGRKSTYNRLTVSRNLIIQRNNKKHIRVQLNPAESVAVYNFLFLFVCFNYEKDHTVGQWAEVNRNMNYLLS
jgi:hypothetical protein